MPYQQLVDYIKKQTAKGVDRTEIKSVLFSSGWQDADIEEAFGAIEKPPEISFSKYASLPGFISLFKETWLVYRLRFWIFLSVIAAPTLLISLISFIGSSSLAVTTSLTIIFSVLFIPAFLFQLWAQAALIFAIKDTPERIGVKESFRRAWRKILPYFWIILINFFVIFGGFSLMTIPGIIFSVWFCFAAYILITEDLRGLNALLKSKEYVRGRWWGVFGRLLGIGLVGLIVMSPALALKALGLEELSNILNSFIWIFLTPFAATYIFLLYQHLKKVKGEFEFKPKNRSWFIFAGIWGIFALIALIALYFSFSYLFRWFAYFLNSGYKL